MSDTMQIAIPEERLGEEEVEANDILEAIDSIEIHTQDDLEFAAESLAEIKGKIKELEDERQSVTKPLNAVIRKINKWFKKPREILERCETKLKTRIAAAHQEEYQRQRQALEEAGKASMEQDEERAEAAMARAEKTTFQPVEGLAFRHGFDYNIVAFEQIPREYLLVDDAKIKKVIKAHDGKVTIPGIKIERTTSVASSAR